MPLYWVSPLNKIKIWENIIENFVRIICLLENEENEQVTSYKHSTWASGFRVHFLTVRIFDNNGYLSYGLAWPFFQLGRKFWLCSTLGNLKFQTCINLLLSLKRAFSQLSCNILCVDGINLFTKKFNKKTMVMLPRSEFLPLHWPTMMECHTLFCLAWNKMGHIYICVPSIQNYFRQNESGWGVPWPCQYGLQMLILAKWYFAVIYHYQTSLQPFPLGPSPDCRSDGVNPQSWLPVFWQATQDRSFLSFHETSGQGGKIRIIGREIDSWGSDIFFCGLKNQIIKKWFFT